MVCDYLIQDWTRRSNVANLLDRHVSVTGAVLSVSVPLGAVQLSYLLNNTGTRNIRKYSTGIAMAI